MNWRSLLLCALTCITAVQGSLFAADTFVGPTLRGVVASPLSSEAAYSILAEVGVRNFRGNGTFAFQVGNSYFKVSADALAQKLRYSNLGHTHYWVHQEAYAGAYAYNFNCGILSTFDFDGYYARAHNKNFSDVVTFTPAADAATASFVTTVERAISGASYYGFSAGITIEPYYTTRVSLAANWDHVDYRTKNRSLSKKKGFGGTVIIQQQILDSVVLDLKGSWRRPFDDYQGALNWFVCGCSPCDRASFGVFGGYTHGRYGVPNVANAGIQVGYFFGGSSSCYDPCEFDPCCEPCQAFDLVAWTARPAVYIPVVLSTQDVSSSVVTNPLPL